MSFSLLKEEVLTDPLGRGYAGMTDAEVSARMAIKDRTRNKTRLSTKEISEAITAPDYSGLDPAQKLLLITYLASSEVDPFGFAQIVFLDLFAGGSDTIQALVALRVESITRPEELGISSYNEGDIAAARA